MQNRKLYELINNLTKEGLGILMISSEMEEIMGMSDRMLVMGQREKLLENCKKEEFFTRSDFKIRIQYYIAGGRVMDKSKNFLKQYFCVSGILLFLIVLFGMMSPDSFLTMSNMFYNCSAIINYGIATVGLLFVMIAGD